MGIRPQFYGCNLVTGQIIEEFQHLTPSGPLTRFIGDITSCDFRLPVPQGGLAQPPINWEGATTPFNTMIVVVLFDHPIWAGAVVGRQGGTNFTVNIQTVSLEGYLNRRFVGDHTFNQEDESDVIARTLVDSTNIDEGINFELDTPPTEVLRDRTYIDQNDMTVFEALANLMDVINGLEFTVELDWTNANRTSVTKIFKTRKRIGQFAPTVDPLPNIAVGEATATFTTLGGDDTRYMFSEDYTEGRGANHIVAVSSGEGDERVQSAPARDEDQFLQGFPRWEHRFTPSTGITNIDTLNSHAERRLELMHNGAQTIKLDARGDTYPLIQTDWRIGDDIKYQLVGGRHPNGFEGIARVIGWEMRMIENKVSPIVVLPGETE